jgi:hypothetical protein
MTSRSATPLLTALDPPVPTPRRRDLLREYFLNALTLAVLKEGGSDLEKQGVREEFMQLLRQVHRLPVETGSS